MLDVLIDTLLDTLKIIPFLFLACLLMEYLEHRSGEATENALKKAGRVGPLIGSAFGIIPQCGFSAAASGLYSGRIITTGTLIAVYLSTSDEMLPILISNGAPVLEILKLLAVKFIIGVAAGFLVDGITALYRRSHPAADRSRIEDICEREHCHCDEGGNIAVAALIHTMRVTAFIFVVTLILNTAMHFLGENAVSDFLSARPVLAVFGAALVGLIPNCASSVILTTLYLKDVISLGVVVAGLAVNAGVGLAILFRNNRPLKDSFRIVAILFASGVISGFVIELINKLI